MAEHFALCGARLWLVDIVPPAGSTFLNIDNLDGSLLGFSLLRTSDEKEVADFFRTEVMSTGLDVLVNNAGVGVFSPYSARTYSEFKSVLDTNLFGTFLMSRAAIEIMRKNSFGSIINIGSIYGSVSSDPSIYGDTPRINSEVYSASKAGVIQMSKYFAVHAGPFGVRVNTVSPGGVFLRQGQKFVESYIKKVPMGRMGTPADIVGIVAFLASDGASYITGQNISVDGGLTSW
jgi:NAD(P)-dependent dehydrogenase (short-subunit alcohol dehydrogenase family)